MNSAEKLVWEQELWDEFSSESFEYNKTASRKIHSPVVGIVGMLRSEKLGKDDKLWHEPGAGAGCAEAADVRGISGL